MMMDELEAQERDVTWLLPKGLTLAGNYGRQKRSGGDRLYRSERIKLMSRMAEIKDPCSYGEVIHQNIYRETRQCRAGFNGNGRAERSVWSSEELELATVVEVDDFEENEP